MLFASLAVLALAAVAGVGLVISRVQGGENPPIAGALVHGGLAAAGLLLVGAVGYEASFAGAAGLSTAVLVLTALGGFGLFGLHLSGRTIPLVGVLVHAVAAVVGVGLVVALALGLG